MTSERKVEANRMNAKRSTGPRTEAGKAASSRNAVTHGLTARDVVLPTEDPDAFDTRMAEWLDHYDGDGDPARRLLVERAVHASWRLDRCARYEAARLAHRVRHAEAEFDRLARDRADVLGRNLLDDPINRVTTPATDPATLKKLDRWRENDPPVLVRELSATAQGVDWLLDRWNELARALRDEGYWHYNDKFAALRLLGKRPQDVLEDMKIARVFLACHVAHPEAWDLWDEAFQARLGCDGKPIYVVRINYLKTLLPESPEAALRYLADFVQDEIDRLQTLKAAHLDPVAARDAAEAGARAMFDETAAGTNLRRYETACERELHRAIAGLEKPRKAVGETPRPQRSTAEPERKPKPKPEAEPESPARNEANAVPAKVPSPTIESPRPVRKRPRKPPGMPVSRAEPDALTVV